MLSFHLKMPSVNTWNGKWTGDGKRYYSFREGEKEQEVGLDGESFHYNFGDGWIASVKVEKISTKEKTKRQKKRVARGR